MLSFRTKNNNFTILYIHSIDVLTLQKAYHYSRLIFPEQKSEIMQQRKLARGEYYRNV